MFQSKKTKYALFAFNGDPMCFVHVLLNALDLKEKGHEVKVIIEGSATKLVETYNDPKATFHDLYQKLKKADLIDCVCRACAAKMESLEAAKVQNLNLCAEMSGHPSMGKYIDQGYTIITF